MAEPTTQAYTYVVHPTSHQTGRGSHLEGTGRFTQLLHKYSTNQLSGAWRITISINQILPNCTKHFCV